MPISSDEEDYSKFKDVVDNSFVISALNSNTKVTEKPKSVRYIEEATHYNDYKVPVEMQRRVGAQISALIEKHVEFVEVPIDKNKKQKIKGGVKLFNKSTDFMSSEQPKDNETYLHNSTNKNYKIRKRQLENELDMDEKDKVAACTISGDYILSKKETKLWKSRQKEKIFKYKHDKSKKCLVSVD